MEDGLVSWLEIYCVNKSDLMGENDFNKDMPTGFLASTSSSWIDWYSVKKGTIWHGQHCRATKHLTKRKSALV